MAADGPEQLALDLPLAPGQGRDDLVVGPANRSAVTWLDAWPEWPSRIAVLAGPVGCGKTHLAKLWAERAGARFIRPETEPLEPPPEQATAIVVENMVQGAFSETWLFHLFNAVRQQDGYLLLTSRRWPGDWGIALPDLQSRLRTAHLMEVSEPDDMLLRGVLSKLFADRQLVVAPAVIDYLALRMERSLGAAQKVVDTLDTLSISRKNAVTRPLAADALRKLGWKD